MITVHYGIDNKSKPVWIVRLDNAQRVTFRRKAKAYAAADELNGEILAAMARREAHRQALAAAVTRLGA